MLCDGKKVYYFEYYIKYLYTFYTLKSVKGALTPGINNSLENAKKILQNV